MRPARPQIGMAAQPANATSATTAPVERPAAASHTRSGSASNEPKVPEAIGTYPTKEPLARKSTTRSTPDLAASANQGAVQPAVVIESDGAKAGNNAPARGAMACSSASAVQS